MHFIPPKTAQTEGKSNNETSVKARKDKTPGARQRAGEGEGSLAVHEKPGTRQKNHTGGKTLHKTE